jgi:hypothetical protein
MPTHRRHLSRARRRTLLLEFGSLEFGSCRHLSHDTETFSIWLPDPDEPLLVETFAHAADLAFEVLDMPVTREVLVLLDEQRSTTAILLDPPPPIGVLVGRSDVPGLEVSFCQTLSIVPVERVHMGPPSATERTGYLALRRMHVLQGLQLLDVMLVDPERVRSLAIGCDPDPIWFEQFGPVATAPYHLGP